MKKRPVVVIAIWVLFVSLFSFAETMMSRAGAVPSNTTTVGTSFNLAFAPGYGTPGTTPSNTNYAWTIYLTGSSSGSATVLWGDGSSVTVSITQDSVTAVDVPISAVMAKTAGAANNKVAHLTSTVPIAAYGCSRQNFSSDCTIFYPSNVIGSEYRALYATNNSGSVGAEFLVLVGSNKDESVTLTATRPTNSSLKNFSAAGDSITVTLGADQVYYIKSGAIGTDFSGMKISSTGPIGFINGTELDSFPLTFPGSGGAGDAGVQMVPPISTWGKSFYSSNYSNKSATGSGYRITTDTDNTLVTITGDTNTSYILNAGDVITFSGYLRTGSSPNLGISVSASNPILIGHYFFPGSYENGDQTSFSGVLVANSNVVAVPNSAEFANLVLGNTVTLDPSDTGTVTIPPGTTIISRSFRSPWAITLSAATGGTGGNTSKLLTPTSTSGDPSMAYVPPFQQYMSKYTVVNPTGFIASFLNLIVRNSDTSSVTLDNSLVAFTKFRNIPGTSWSTAQLTVSIGSHNIFAPNAFGVEAYGANAADSYAYMGGQNLASINSIASLMLNSNSDTQTVGQEICIPVFVKDGSGNPIPGVRVDALIAGANSGSPSQSSDSFGVATICYTGNLSGTDSVSFSANGVTNVIAIEWLSSPNGNVTQVQSPIPDPIQSSTISDVSPLTGPLAGATVVNVAGSFAGCRVLNVSVDGTNLPVSKWMSSPDGVSITMPAHRAGAVEIMIWDGCAPVLQPISYLYANPAQAVTAPAAPANSVESTTAGISTPAAADTSTPVAQPVAPASPAPVSKKIEIYFAMASHKVGSSAIAKVERFAKEIAKLGSDISVIVKGYAQPTPGTESTDGALSERRAAEIAKILNNSGISASIAYSGAGRAKLNLPTSRYVEVVVKRK